MRSLPWIVVGICDKANVIRCIQQIDIVFTVRFYHQDSTYLLLTGVVELSNTELSTRRNESSSPLKSRLHSIELTLQQKSLPFYRSSPFLCLFVWNTYRFFRIKSFCSGKRYKCKRNQQHFVIHITSVCK